MKHHQQGFLRLRRRPPGYPRGRNVWAELAALMLWLGGVTATASLAFIAWLTMGGHQPWLFWASVLGASAGPMWLGYQWGRNDSDQHWCRLIRDDFYRKFPGTRWPPRGPVGPKERK